MSKEKSKKQATPKSSKEEIAIILIRSTVGVRADVKTTLNTLRLRRKNACVVIPYTNIIKGMLQIIKDYTTWGIINSETKKLLIEKRGVKKGNSIKPFFRLSPPFKGYGRKGIKTPFNVSGALGDRKADINDILKRMI